MVGNIREFPPLGSSQNTQISEKLPFELLKHEKYEEKIKSQYKCLYKQTVKKLFEVRMNETALTNNITPLNRQIINIILSDIKSNINSHLSSFLLFVLDLDSHSEKFVSLLEKVLITSNLRSLSDNAYIMPYVKKDL